ncbi:hypothetical protein BASA81_001291 [Batrachochytrium salamandrivorans]|nr:hypothetical protein BASA81_001291 [Batrachochytrium salamandrivorans]
MHVDERAFAFVLRRLEQVKLENAQLQRSEMELKVLATSRMVAKQLVESNSNAQVTLNSKLKNLLPKCDKVDQLRALLLLNPLAVQTWRDTGTGGSMLHVAAESNNLPAVMLLVHGFNHALEEVDLCGRTALHLAAWKQSIKVCEFLINEIGPDAARGENAPVDMAGYTPAALSALALNLYDYDANKQQDYEQVRRSVKKFLHVKGDACVSPRRLAALNRSAGGKSKLRTLQPQVVLPSVTYGTCLMNGWGIKMEDYLFAMSPVEDYEVDLHVFAVFDGHGGALCAKQCTEEMLPRLLATQSLLSAGDEQELVEFAQNTIQGMEIGLQTMPEFAWREIEIRPTMGGEPAVTEWQLGDGSGTTCVLVLVTSELICVAHVGDSRAALISSSVDDQDIAITRDHKLTLEEGTDGFVQGEVERIERLGGYVINGKRVSVDKDGKTSLGMTRSLGDFWAKRNTSPQGEHVISPLPEVWIQSRKTTTNGFLVLASDGVWDVVSERDVGEFIRAKVNQQGAVDLHQIANDLCDYCLERDSQDNMSAIIIDLRSFDSHSPVRRPIFE